MCLSVAGWSYNVEAPGGEAVAYWRDVSCDTVVGEQEVATLVLRSPGALTVSNMVALPRGLAFTERFADGRTNLIAWIDEDGDFAVDLDERTVVASGDGVHLVGPAPNADAGDLLYRDGETVLLWRRGAAAQAVSPTAAFARCDSMVLHGPGGGCLAGGDVIERGSWSTVGHEAMGALYASTSSTADGTVNALSFRTPSSVVIRGLLDGRATRAERPRDLEFAGAPEIGMIADGQPQFLIRGQGHRLERWRPLRVTRFLNEACDAEMTCASGLTCAISGNAPEARCVVAREP